MSVEEQAQSVFLDLFENVPEFRALVGLANEKGGAVMVYLLKGGELKLNVFLLPDPATVREDVREYVENGADDTIGFVYYIPKGDIQRINVTVIPNPPKAKDMVDKIVDEITHKLNEVVGA